MFVVERKCTRRRKGKGLVELLAPRSWGGSGAAAGWALDRGVCASSQSAASDSLRHGKAGREETQEALQQWCKRATRTEDCR